MPSPPTIRHLATHNTNIGDGALISAIQSRLTGLCPEIRFLDDDLMRYANYMGRTRFDADFIQDVNRSCDLLLVGGGGLLDGSRSHDQSGMGFNIRPELLRELESPPAFAAVGFNLFSGQKYLHLDRLRRTLEVLAGMEGVLFSTRLDGSLARLRQAVGMDLEFIQEVCDPGFFVETQPADHLCLDAGRRNILLQLAGDRPDDRFAGERPALGRRWFAKPRMSYFLKELALRRRRFAKRQMRRFLKELARGLERVCRREDANLVLCPHLVRDLDICAEFVSLCPKDFSRFRLKVGPVLRGKEDAPGFFDLYRRVDAVIGMRGHSGWCAVGLGTPFVALNSHPKIRGFMKEADLEGYCLDVSSPGLAKSVEEKLSLLLKDAADYHERRERFAVRANASLLSFERQVVERLT